MKEYEERDKVGRISKLAGPNDVKCKVSSINGLMCDYFEGHELRNIHYNIQTNMTFEDEISVNSTLTLKVSECFYSLQGEGARAGEPSIFIRLQGCSAKHACYASGVECDTEFESGKEMTLQEILFEATEAIDRTIGSMPNISDNDLKKNNLLWIVFTGGEPLDSLTPEILGWFIERGYKIALETSGTKYLSQQMAEKIEHITISPKCAEHVLTKNFGHLNRDDGLPVQSTNRCNFINVDELRYVRHAGQPGIPQPSLKAKYYYLSPHSDGAQINRENLKHCIKLCLENPKWRLSLQSHKLLGVL
jgi:organic radical activating enzyme